MNNWHENDYFLKKEITFSLQKGLLYSLFISSIWLIIHIFILYFINKHFFFINEALNQSIFLPEYLIPIFFIGIFTQEFIKIIILKINAKVEWSHLKIGFSMASLMPYVECKYPIPIRAYRLSLIIPTIIILQTIWLTYIFGLYEFIIFSAFWLFFSTFELITFFKTKLYSSGHYLVATHTKLPGAIIYDNPFNE